MSERFNRFTTQIGLANNDWRVIVGNPYVSAYTKAYASYKDTLDRQKQADKEAGELFVAAACVVTGSFLLGSIGKVSMQMIAKRTVVQIANSSLFNNYRNVFRIIRKNEGAAFAVGKFIDAASGSIKSNAEKIATTYLQDVSSVLSPEPLVQFLDMDSFMRANVNCAIRMAQMIEQNSDLNDAQKTDAYAPLKNAPLYNKPVKRQSKYNARLDELIELTFYLSAVLDSDSLISWPAASTMGGTAGMMSETRGATSTPINQRPTAPDYPKPAMPQPGFGYTPAHKSVGISRGGSEIQKRTNELCMKVFNKPLYGSSFFGLGGPADTLKGDELRQADMFLADLAVVMKPQNPMDAIH